MKPLQTRYANKMVDGKFYQTIKVSGTESKPKVLTEEEFNAGKPGLVYIDNETGKLTFNKQTTNMKETFYEMHRSEAIQVLLGKDKLARTFTNLKLAEKLEKLFPKKKRLYLVREDHIKLEGDVLTAKTF